MLTLSNKDFSTISTEPNSIILSFLFELKQFSLAVLIKFWKITYMDGNISSRMALGPFYLIVTFFKKKNIWHFIIIFVQVSQMVRDRANITNAIR